MGLAPYRWLWIALGVCLLTAITAYWLLIITEGTYLGARVVAWLYDLTAHRYDRIKAVQYPFELRFIGAPLLQALEDSPAWLMLDVAAGTGRISRALAAAGASDGRIISIDRSRQMMLAAPPNLGTELITEYAQQDATNLGFRDAVFDGISCLEALEFFARPQRAIQEMLRVLKPGGILLISNRVGFDARLFPGRLCGRGNLENYLRQLGLENVRSQRWQVYYDLIWANKPSSDR